MVWICSPIFVDRWLERAERHNVQVDDGDRFISLWIAFNAWMKGKYGELKRDRELINKVKKNNDLSKLFDELKSKDIDFLENLKKIKGLPVDDMRHMDAKGRTKVYKGTYESLIDVLYQIRCNLFHGRKDSTKNEKDFELIRLAYKILIPLFKAYWQKNGP